jgi:Flp pilus assembly pilin Flp
MAIVLYRLWSNDEAQDVAEYAMMLAIILVLVIAIMQAIGTNANNVFSKASSVLNIS